MYLQDKKAAMKEFLAKIVEKDDNVRGKAWQSAGPMGARVVVPLARIMSSEKYVIAKEDPEAVYKTKVVRSAKRAIWKIVRHAGRPGADKERKAVVKALLRVLGNEPKTPVAREAMWMLSEIGGDESVDPVVARLTDKVLREDARMVLQRIPGEKSLAALKAGLVAAPEEFKINIAQSLRQRGVEVPGHPCQKLVPRKKK